MLQLGREAEGSNDRYAPAMKSGDDDDDDDDDGKRKGKGRRKGIKVAMGPLTGALLRREAGF